VRARVQPGLDVFAALGYTHATFKDGSISSGVRVAGNRIPNTPDYTATIGSLFSRALGSSVTVFGGADVTFVGAYTYDDLNQAGQAAYSLARLRGGLRANRLTVEAWARNLFDTAYVPVAFAFDPRLAPSGFVGESGAPRTFGITAGVTF
jgi:iron complex outermembrane receptor protein